MDEKRAEERDAYRAHVRATKDLSRKEAFVLHLRALADFIEKEQFETAKLISPEVIEGLIGMQGKSKN